jgi:eukaryotic-like serine/threonine-protein kinase
MASLRDRYQLGPRIGGGGMAEVFEAALVGAEGFTRPVAVKRMLPALSADARFGGLFVNEARLAALLHHPNIASVLDFDRDDDGRYFLVMELIRGVDLRRLTATGRVPLEVALHVAVEILRGLAHAHELDDGGQVLGVLHRDVSPHNVMLSWDGAVKLVDFGIARAAASNEEWRRTTGLRGKVAYMSPEQARGEALDHRSDQFAAGIITHELLTGRRVFEGATDPEILARLMTQPIPRPRVVAPDVPPAADAVVMRMLERDRDSRYSTTAEALDAILACPAVSARGGLALRAVLRERFVAEAPQRRGDSGPLPREEHGATTPVPAPVPAPPVALPLVTLSSHRPTAAPVWPAEAPPWLRVRAPLLIATAVAVVAAVTALVVRGTDSDRLVASDQAQSPSRTDTSPGPIPSQNPLLESIPGGHPFPDPTANPNAPPDPTTNPPPIPGPISNQSPTSTAKPISTRAQSTAPRRRGRLVVRVDPWAEVTVDGRARGTTALVLSLDEGDHTVVLTNAELGRRERVPVKILPDHEVAIDRRWR